MLRKISYIAALFAMLAIFFVGCTEAGVGVGKSLIVRPADGYHGTITLSEIIQQGGLTTGPFSEAAWNAAGFAKSGGPTLSLEADGRIMSVDNTNSWDGLTLMKELFDYLEAGYLAEAPFKVTFKVEAITVDALSISQANQPYAAIGTAWTATAIGDKHSFEVSVTSAHLNGTGTDQNGVRVQGKAGFYIDDIIIEW